MESADIPPDMQEMFERAEKYVSEHFSTMKVNPAHGSLTIGGERYILIRAESMSVEFLRFIEGLYPHLSEEERFRAASSILFDIAHSIGRADARHFHAKTGVEDLMEKMSTGPVHFAYSGWAFVKLLPSSKPTPDRFFQLCYEHPNSFESDAWLASGRKSEQPVCHMNAGYSSGWCAESAGMELTAREVLCRARGDEACRFVMAHPSRIEEAVDEILEHNGG